MRTSLPLTLDIPTCGFLCNLRHLFGRASRPSFGGPQLVELVREAEQELSSAHVWGHDLHGDSGVCARAARVTRVSCPDNPGGNATAACPTPAK